jgi:FKBP-type peptidyl-prolyl cis-trans isomerase FklB
MMKKKLLIAVSLLITFGLSIDAQNSKKSAAVKPVSIETPSDTLSYAFGANLAAQGLKQYLGQLGIDGDANKMVAFLKGLNESLPSKGENSPYIAGLGIGDQIYKMSLDFAKRAFVNGSGEDVNISLVAKGVTDALLGNALSVDSVGERINKTMEAAERREAEVKARENDEQKEKGIAFLAANKLNDSVTVLPSGLQYKIIEKGDGAIPTINDRVTVHYKGMLIDGTEFDSSYGRGEPLTLGVKDVIPGWTEALQLMPVGSKWLLYIPQELAYGERGAGNAIPPYSTLIFEVNLLNIESNNE